MSEATTAEVARVYALAPVSLGECEHLNTNPDYARKRFDRWLAAHDREVKAKVLREMADDWMYPDRISRLFQDWLRETATSIESEARP